METCRGSFVAATFIENKYKFARQDIWRAVFLFPLNGEIRHKCVVIELVFRRMLFLFTARFFNLSKRHKGCSDGHTHLRHGMVLTNEKYPRYTFREIALRYGP